MLGMDAKCTRDDRKAVTRISAVVKRPCLSTAAVRDGPAVGLRGMELTRGAGASVGTEPAPTVEKGAVHVERAIRGMVEGVSILRRDTQHDGLVSGALNASRRLEASADDGFNDKWSGVLPPASERSVNSFAEVFLP